jgi:hypothetical protein
MNKFRLLNVITLLVTLVANGLATGLSLGGRTTGQISDSFPVLFTPAGYVFSIWSVIYTGLIAFTIYQALPSQKSNPRIERIGPWFIISNLLNTAWIFLWQYGYFTLTLFVMLPLLFSLAMIFRRLNQGGESVKRSENWLVNIPFSIYLGWISVATIANFTITLYNLGWTGGGIPQELWAIAVILVAILLGLFMTLRQKQIAFPLVLIWAFIGIAVKQSAYVPVEYAAILGAALLAITLILRVLTSRRQPEHNLTGTPQVQR